VYTIVWEFRAREGGEGEFEAAYGPDGAWAALFSRAPGYLGTELLRDAADPGRYLTVDRWETLEAYEAFRSTFEAEYRTLDEQCEGLTDAETLVGRFDAV
jgi:heme-degrading monooxygenase HmoA